MNRVALLLFALLANFGMVQAQTQNTSPWGSVYIGGGAFFSGGQSLIRNDIVKLAPGSTLLAVDLSDHSFSNNTYVEGTGLFDMAISLHPWQKDAGHGPELRLGLLYGGRAYQGAQFYRIDRTPYDTLTSNQTGEQYFVDSVNSSTYWINSSSERFGLNSSLLWRTSGRWSIYGGVGIAGGLLVNARTEVWHDLYSGVSGQVDQYANAPYGYGPSHGYAATGENFRNGTGWWLAFYTPVGLDFQIARTSPFWSRVHLFTEVRPQVAFQGSPELGTSTGFGVQSVFGVRFRI